MLPEFIPTSDHRKLGRALNPLVLSGVRMLARVRNGNDLGWFGGGWEFTGASGLSSSKFTFSESLTPVVTSIEPTMGISGELITIRGHHFKSAFPVTDTNW